MCAARAPQVIGYTQIPLACWAMSGKACSLFWWAPERMPTAEQRAEKVAAGSARVRAGRNVRRTANAMRKRGKGRVDTVLRTLLITNTHLTHDAKTASLCLFV